MNFINIQMGKILKIGNSEGVVIPSIICEQLKLFRGDKVAFGVYDENTLVVRRLTNEQLANLKGEEIKNIMY